jgi:uncharacterized membrane protein
MKTFQSSVTIQRPIEDVFAAAIDVSNHNQWREGLIQASITSQGPVNVNSTYVYNLRTMGQNIETTSEVVSFSPPFEYAWKATSGPFPLEGKVICETVPEGTRLTEILAAEPGGFFKLAEPLLFRNQQTKMDKDLKRFKELLENGK